MESFLLGGTKDKLDLFRFRLTDSHFFENEQNELCYSKREKMTVFFEKIMKNVGFYMKIRILENICHCKLDSVPL